MDQQLPVCLTIAGSDSGGGAGIQADLRTFAYFGTFGTSVLTALTAQTPHGVSDVHPVPMSHVVAQYRAVTTAFTVRAIKTGMLFATDIVAAVAHEMRLRDDVPLVVDPVMIATSGARLLRESAIKTLTRELLPLATLITPNLPEAEVLGGEPLPDLDAVIACARGLAAYYGVAVLLKGGHCHGPEVTDVLATKTAAWLLTAPAVAARSTHGTGCTLSAAITANLAQGRELLPAVIQAKAYVVGCLAHCRQAGPETWVMQPPAGVDASVVRCERAD